MSEHRIQLFVIAVNVLLTAVLLFGAIFNLYFVAEEQNRLGLVAGYTVTFAICVGLLTNARRSEIFGACAAYAAVLVVFVSGNIAETRNTTKSPCPLQVSIRQCQDRSFSTTTYPSPSPFLTPFPNTLPNTNFSKAMDIACPVTHITAHFRSPRSTHPLPPHLLNLLLNKRKAFSFSLPYAVKRLRLVAERLADPVKKSVERTFSTSRPSIYLEGIDIYNIGRQRTRRAEEWEE